MADHHSPPPKFGPEPLAPGYLPNLRFDVLSGFLVFLIALPLCLGIAKASNFPAISGVWTAVVGGVLGAVLSNSQLTIKGPAAGLIVIVEGAVIALGREKVGPDAPLSEVIAAGYPLALGVGVVAGVIQTLFGLFRAGRLGELVPLTPVHGMLAAIGITIMAKQFFPMLGMTAPGGEPIKVIAAIPENLTNVNWTVAPIGLVSLAVLIGFPYLKGAVKLLKPVPAQVVVLAVAIPMGLALGLAGMTNDAGQPKFLVSIPNVLADPSKAFFFPDFSSVLTTTGVEYVVLFALIASIESLLSAQAVDMIDPWKRKSDMNRDLLATGVGNTLAACVGALPMISEIVRSKANIDNGARTKVSNLCHGLFLLAFVLLAPGLIGMIPLAALGAMLVFVGFRLGSPREFFAAYRLGVEQLVVFVATIAVTLSTDLLIGVVSGIALKFVFHWWNGAAIGTMLKPDAVLLPAVDGGSGVVSVRGAAVFSNWLGIRRAILAASDAASEVVVDLSGTVLVDHSTLEKLHELEQEFTANGKRLVLAGLGEHTASSSHPRATRKRKTTAGTPVTSA